MQCHMVRACYYVIDCVVSVTWQHDKSIVSMYLLIHVDRVSDSIWCMTDVMTDKTYVSVPKKNLAVWFSSLWNWTLNNNNRRHTIYFHSRNDIINMLILKNWKKLLKIKYRSFYGINSYTTFDIFILHTTIRFEIIKKSFWNHSPHGFITYASQL